jgi:hypothetical protein
MGKTQLTGNLTNAIFQDASNNVGIGAAPSGSYKLEVTGTSRFTSNVGIGASLSAWISTAKALQLNDTASLFGPTSEAILGNNIFVDSTDNNKYITTNFASQYRQVNGQHIFYSAASGTAGTTISFGTPKLTINSNGNVGIGVTPNTWSSVYKTLQIGASMSLLQDGSSTSSYWGGNLYVGTDGNYRYTINGTGGLFGIESGSIVYYGVASGTAGNVASLIERFNVGLSSSFKIYTPSGTSETLRLTCADTIGDGYMSYYRTTGVRKAYLGYGGSNDDIFSIMQEENAAITFGTNATERMRINSGGGVNIGSGGANAFSNGLTSFNLDMATVGLFSYSAQLYFFNNTYHNGSTGFYYKYSGSGVGGIVVENAGNITFVTAPSGTANNLVTLTTRMTITQGGNIGAPSGTNIYNASDLRLKQNVTTVTNGLNKILALKPVKFNWIDGFEPSEDGKDMLGFIAQEVQDVIPEAVENFSNSSVVVGETIVENPLRVNEKFIIPVLVKAIQELNERLNKAGL